MRPGSKATTPNAIKSPGMNNTHRELFKKSKIIEIGSRRKKLQPPKVGDV